MVKSMQAAIQRNDIRSWSESINIIPQTVGGGSGETGAQTLWRGAESGTPAHWGWDDSEIKDRAWL